MNKKKLTYIVVFFCTVVIGIFCAVKMPDSPINNEIRQVQTELIKEIIVSEETKSEVVDTKNAVDNGGKVETKEIVVSNIKEEEKVTDEGAEDNLEADALVEQENISYDGDNAGKGANLLGKWQGLTYYSQADSRWASKLYTSTSNRTQTMKSSACGPTSAAMVVSSAKGAILPTTMANLSVTNGFRTANSGTAWAFYPFVADYFGFNEYHTTSNFETAMNYLKQKNSIGTSKYYIICSCGSGLFTSGGHYIVLALLDGNTIQVLDPYLYSGKFNTASRKRANVTVKGTSAYVSKSNFEKYANAKKFWIFSNDKGNEKKSSNSQVKNATKNNTSKTTINKQSTYTRYVKVSTYLNVRKGPGTNYKIIDKLQNGIKVTIYEVKGDWRRIGKNRWINSKYITDKLSNTYSSYKVKITARVLNVRSGPGKSYKIKTSVKRNSTYTIVETKNGWGKLKSGAGWIKLSYTKKV